MNHNRCPRKSEPLCAGISSVCDLLEKLMQLKHALEKRLTSVLDTLENQLETLHKSLLVFHLIQ